MFFFISPPIPPYLRAPSADRRETLPHDRKLAEFYNAGPKIPWALPPTKKWSQNMQNLIANISETAQDIQNRKAN